MLSPGARLICTVGRTRGVNFHKVITVSEMTAPPSLDVEKAEAFASRLLRALNDAAFCLMTSVGHRTGLFDAMRDQPPLTSREVASRAGLNERYVREWLGTMVTSGVVSVDPQSVRFEKIQIERR